MKRSSGLASLALLLLFPLHAAGFLHVPVSYTRLPAQRGDIWLRAKKGVVPDNYVDHYVVLGLTKQVLLTSLPLSFPHSPHIHSHTYIYTCGYWIDDWIFGSWFVFLCRLPPSR